MKLFILAIFSLSAANAMAAHHTKGYQSLRDVEMYPAYQPRFEHGIDGLQQREMRYKEKLPLQLSQSIQKISTRQYKPSIKANRY